jgi:hypothetical protein
MLARRACSLLLLRLTLSSLCVACDDVELELVRAPSGEPCTICGNQCVDLGEDRKNCGACGQACEKNLVCCAGSCTALKDDPVNCGACGVTCPAEASCKDKACSCPPAEVYCDGACVAAKESPCGAK